MNTLNPCYHAGKSDPNKWKGAVARILDAAFVGNSYYMGVETVEKGQKKTFTDAQKQSMGKLISVLADIFDWKNLELAHLNHKTYARHKVDTKYTDEQIHDFALK